MPTNPNTNLSAESAPNTRLVRRQWQHDDLDLETFALLNADSRVFLHQTE